jgi:phage replication-related protein YjqB (UPF0714/DUF867 family)
MPDHYANFYALSQSETAGLDYRIHLARAAAEYLVIAPHGGGIEPGTSEIALAIAAERFSFYSFEGLKSSGNSDLHLTSTRFDEPACLALIGQSDIVVTIHGETGAASGEAVFVGGGDLALGELLTQALRDNAFSVPPQSDQNLRGREPCNLCNRGRTAAGVQLELSLALRTSMFQDLTREGRRQTREPFDRFVRTVAQVLGEEHESRRSRGANRTPRRGL